MTKESAPVQEGEVVAGKYRVGRVLGQGGMGVIFAATHLQLDQPVALKFLLPAVVANPEVVARFTREAQAAAKIRSEHVARVIDVGALEGGVPYMVMEYLEGEDLERALAARGPLPIAEAVDYLLQGCEAVAEAHALGIIHRDLKPANLFLAQRPGGRPIVKVLDFGISKAPTSASDAALTSTTAMFGSPLYMSPEQVTSSRSVDMRSDVWSLGAVLYELLTSRHLFEMDSMAELVVAILQKDPLPPGAHRPNIPALLELAVMRCLEKDPARRFSDVAALAAAIAPFGPPRSIESVERISHVLGPQPVARTQVAIASQELPATASTQLAGESAAEPASPAASRGQPAKLAKPVAITVAKTAKTATTSATTKATKPARMALVVCAVIVVGGAAAARLLGAKPAQPAAPPSASPARSPPASPPTAIGNPPLAAPTLTGPSAHATRPAEPPRTVVAPEAPSAPSAPPRLRRGPVAAAKAHPIAATGDAAPTTRAAPGASTEPPAGKLRPSPPPAPCARMLERLSLGETLTPQEDVLYAQQCRK